MSSCAWSALDLSKKTICHHIWLQNKILTINSGAGDPAGEEEDGAEAGEEEEDGEDGEEDGEEDGGEPMILHTFAISVFCHLKHNSIF